MTRLKSYRDRLTHCTTHKPEFEYELLTMFARNETSAPFAMPALCFIFYIVLMFWLPSSKPRCGCDRFDRPLMPH